MPAARAPGALPAVKRSRHTPSPRVHTIAASPPERGAPSLDRFSPHLERSNQNQTRTPVTTWAPRVSRPCRARNAAVPPNARSYDTPTYGANFRTIS